MNVTSLPVRIPSPVTHIDPGYEVYSTLEHDIIVDGLPLEDRLVVAFDLYSPMPSGADFERILQRAMSSRRGMKVLELFNTHFESYDHVWEKVETLNKLNDMNDRKVDAESYDGAMLSGDPLHVRGVELSKLSFVNKVNRVVPMLRGLMCWDLIHQGGNSPYAAAKELVQLHNDISISSENMLTALRTVENHINNYRPKNLPWL